MFESVFNDDLDLTHYMRINETENLSPWNENNLHFVHVIPFNFDYGAEHHAWCRDHFGLEKWLTGAPSHTFHNEKAIWDFLEHQAVYFANETDALLFKMRWC